MKSCDFVGGAAIRRRNMLRWFIQVVALLTVASAASAQVTAIRVGRIVDPATDTVTTDQTILVEDKKITAVGSSVGTRKRNCH